MSRPGGQSNQIAKHPDRLAIELARVAGVSLDKIAAKYGVHRDAIHRHMTKLSDAYKAALAADVPLVELAERAAKEGGSVLDHLGIIRMTVMAQMLAASACGDTVAVARLARAATEANVAIGKITGEMLETPAIRSVTNNVVFMASPFMASLETMLAQALTPYPAAMRAVVDGLRSLQTPADAPTALIPTLDANAA